MHSISKLQKKFKKLKEDYNKNKISQIIQIPNLPLSIWIASKIIMFVSKGFIYNVATEASILFISIWAYLEITKGINVFRKLLGLVVFILTAVSLFHQLKF
jgi:hypothetical protein